MQVQGAGKVKYRMKYSASSQRCAIYSKQTKEPKKQQISDMAREILFLHLHPPPKKILIAQLSLKINIHTNNPDFRRQIIDLPSMNRSDTITQKLKYRALEGYICKRKCNFLWSSNQKMFLGGADAKQLKQLKFLENPRSGPLDFATENCKLMGPNGPNPSK